MKNDYRGHSLDRYSDNLHINAKGEVYSYTTIVARIDREKNELHELGKWSVTTSTHVNYVAKYYGLKKVEDWNK